MIGLLFFASCKQDNSTHEAIPQAQTTKKELKKSTTKIVEKKTNDIPIVDVTSEWKEISDAQGISLDLRYATSNNFVKTTLYDCPRCYLRPEVAEALEQANNELLAKGYKLKMFDCYRPQGIQEKLWEIKPDEDYVTMPSKGSMHSRGLAVDLTLETKEGQNVDMGTDFDYFGEKAHYTYREFPQEILRNRYLLKHTMEKYGFKSIRTEWWHYSMTDLKYPLSDWEWTCK